MRVSRRDQLALAFLALVCAFLAWRAHDRGLFRRTPGAGAPAVASSLARQQPLLVTSVPPAATAAVPPVPRWVPLTTLAAGAAPRFRDAEVTNRLRNTPASLGELIRNDRAILLRNALIDTASGEPLPIPAALRSSQPADVWIVQSRGPITPAFRDRLARAGATVESYIPNNALLVRASAEVADQLAVAPETAGVLPLEPYFKLTPGLLALALAEAPLPDGLGLILTIPDAPAEVAGLTALGAREVFRERGPFGTLLTVEAPRNSLIAIAALPFVRRVEPQRTVKLANDLTAYSLGSTTTPQNTNSFEDLDGTGVLVNVNDSGIDATQPDLTGRVFTFPPQPGDPDPLVDPNGHGTHVAGIIAGDGSMSDTANSPPLGPPQGSVTNANFQGKAPKASLYILPVDLLFGPPSGDAFLQETAAQAPQRFNSEEEVLISNNSWGYLGLDAFEYSSHSASYDAAVRDALPRKTGDQPILYVFSAGNEGFGGNNGVGGLPDSVASPGNAKNVVTVGALENFRSLTNAIVYDTNSEPVQIGGFVIKPGWETNPGPFFTNEVFLPFTDSAWQVASYSSRGNVGIGIEGPVGRFKPDVVAEGSFVLSTRSTQWTPPELPDPTNIFYPTSLLFDELDAQVAPNYRYELGTSMSAPAISGLLAQLQQYFEQKANQSPSAAAYKALLINSAQPTSPGYVPNQDNPVNYAGWGKPNLQRALGRGFRARIGGNETDVIGLDSSEGLATGQSTDFALLLVATNALDVPLRLALVWTDPAGDPIVGPKLVNDLDLVVSNVITGEIFWGNDFDPETGFSRPHSTNEVSTNGLPTLDRINNVERLVLQPPLSSNYVVTVIGNRVNVDTRRGLPGGDPSSTNIVQDFALGFSSDTDPAFTNSIGILDVSPGFNPISLGFVRPPVGTITNGYLLSNQRVGANSPLVDGTNGTFRQWQFYQFTNGPTPVTNFNVILENGTPLVSTNGSNVIFLTFPVGNLSRARTNGPDVDLYVSRNPLLTNLNSTVVAEALKSTTRGGREIVIITNAAVSDDEVFYVGVKSEDHQAGDYGFIGVSTDESFFDSNGQPQTITIPLKQPIPDGTPADPGLALYLAISAASESVRSVYPEVTTTHQNFPDLLTQLDFSGVSVVLQNHTQLDGLESGTNVQVIYDDTVSGLEGAIPSDGPGTLIDFIGSSSLGGWMLSTVDNALGNTGRINDFNLDLSLDFLQEGEFEYVCIPPGFARLTPPPINVPPEASRLTITITNLEPPLPLQVFIKRGQFPDIFNPANNDKYAEIAPPGGSVSIGIRDVPPLQAGRYFVLVYNPNGTTVCSSNKYNIERNLDASFTKTFLSDDSGAIPDVARRFATITVDDPRAVTAMDVGLRIDHPRVSDLALRLESPLGYSAVLFEQRGGQGATALGSSPVSTNGEYQYVALTYEPANRRAMLYLNGVLATQRVLPAGFVPATSNLFYFAKDPTGEFKNDGVKLDDFGVWRRALRPQEIQDIYLNGLAGETKQVTDRNNGLFAWWPLDGTGADPLGTNQAVFTAPFVPVVGVTPSQIGTFFPPPGFGQVTNYLAPPKAAGFTLEGWVAVAPTITNAVFAGWGDEFGTQFGPALVSGGAFGKGSVVAILLDVTGQQYRLQTAPDQLVPGGLVTNVLFATFSENTNRSSEKIKFVPPPFTGQLQQEQVLSVDTFEQVEPTIYGAGASFRGWEVISNYVQVVADPAVAYSGSRYLALSNGVVTRSFTAAVGDRYQVAFLARQTPGDTNLINPLVRLDGVAVTPPPLSVGTNDWETNFFEIRATKPTVVIEFDGSATPAGSPGLLLDDVAFIQTKGTVSYLPEEPISALLGATPGTWTLELNDTRAPYVGDLLEWQLTLTFAPASIPAVRLTNGIPYFTNIVGSDPSYFFIDIPLEASTTTNLLQSITGGPLALWYNPIGLPGEGALPEDTAIIYPTVGTNFNFYILNTNVPPILVPGQRYFMSVQNLNPASSNQFAIQVDFGIPITPLTNAIPYAATNANNGFIDYYSFQVSTNALGVTFLLTNLSDNLQLVVRKGPQLPTRTQYDYASTNSGTQSEVIEIDQAEQPVPLSPGTWYLGVYADSTNTLVPISYTILATEALGTVIPLINGVAYNGTITNTGGVSYFYLDITDEPLIGTFALSNLTANANLYLTKGLPLPSPTRFDYAGTNLGTAPEVITLVPGSTPVALSQGRWYLAVVAVDPAPLDFTVVGTYVPNTFTIIPLNDAEPFEYFDAPPTNSLYFSFDVPPGINAVLFEIYGLTGDATLLVSKGVLPPYAVPPNIYSVPRPGDLSERVAVRTDAVPNLAGPWFLQVDVTSTNVIDFTVRAATQQDGLLLSGEPLTATYLPEDPPKIVIDSVPGEVYRTIWTTDLATPVSAWNEWDVSIATGDTLVVVLPPVLPGDTQRFYLVIPVPQ